MFKHRIVVGIGVLMTAASAFAEEPTKVEDRRARDQLALDLSVVPPGQGAVFVPALTESTLEPEVALVQDGASEPVARGFIGRRIIVAPGRYTAVIEQGGASIRPRSEPFEVFADQTTVLEPFYAVMQLDATDPRGRPSVTRYTIRGAGKGVSAREQYRGRTDKRPAARSRAWLVNPGRYRIALGDGGGTNDRSVALSVHKGELLRYRLVTNGSELLRTELADEDPVYRTSPWRARWRIGADVGFNSSKAQLAGLNGSALQLGGFTDLDLQFNRGFHLARLEVRIGEAWLGVNNRVGRGLPLQKLLDRAEMAVGYDFRLWRFVGPYVRASARTSFFDTRLYVSKDSTVNVPNDDGSTQQQRLNADGSFLLMPYLAPLVLQESAGLSATFIDNELLSFVVRAGPAIRHSFYRGGKYVQSKVGETVNLAKVNDYAGYGAAASASLQVRLHESLWIDSELNGYIDRRQIFDGETFKPVYRWDNRVNLSFNNTVSLAYDFSLERPEFGVERTAVAHLLSLRAHLSIF